MATVTVEMDKAAMAEFVGWGGPLGRSFERLAKETVFRQKALMNVRTGAARASLTYVKGHHAQGLQFDAGSWTVNYARILEEGSKPHEIHAKNAPKLVFFWPKVGKVVAFQSVRHPGTKPYRPLERGLEAAMQMWERGG